jgi:hypothetical protein
VYGHDRRLRHWLEQRQQSYVLAVQLSTHVQQDAHWCWSAKQIAAALSPTAWQRHSSGNGRRGHGGTIGPGRRRGGQLPTRSRHGASGCLCVGMCMIQPM